MQRLILGIYLVFFLFSSCGDGSPKGVLSKSKMTDILVEVHVIDGYLNTLNIDSSRKIMDGYYQQAFKKFDTDSATFNRSMKAYAEDPLLMTDVYTKVNDRLLKMEKDYNQIDSIRNVTMQDSLNRVSRLMIQAQKARDLILNVQLDSTKVDHKLSMTYFLNEAGLGALSERSFYTPPAVVTPATVTSPAEKVDVQPVESLRQQEIKPDTTRAQVIPIDDKRFKPVRR
jgi:hypothetical protein